MSDTPESAYNKFGFDTDFFEIAVDGKTPAKRGAPASNASTDIEDIKAQAFAAGKAAGAAEAMAKTQGELEDVILRFNAALGHLDTARTTYLQNLTQHTMQVLAQTLETLVGDAAKHYPQDILHKHLNDILPTLPHEDQMILRIHPTAKQFHDKLSGTVASIQSHVFKIETDTTMHPGDCLVLWKSGGMDAILAQNTTHLTTLLTSFRADDTTVNAMAEATLDDTSATEETTEPAQPEEETTQDVATSPEVA